MASTDTITGDLPSALKLKGSVNYIPWTGDVRTLLQAKDLDKYIWTDGDKPTSSEWTQGDAKVEWS
jgi:hypothetical protein